MWGVSPLACTCVGLEAHDPPWHYILLQVEGTVVLCDTSLTTDLLR